MVYRRPNCNDAIKYLYEKLQKIDYEYDREGYEKLLKEHTERTGMQKEETGTK